MLLSQCRYRTLVLAGLYGCWWCEGHDGRIGIEIAEYDIKVEVDVSEGLKG